MFGLVLGARFLTDATHYTLKHCQENPALVAAFKSCALPVGVRLIELSKGCVCFTVQAESLSALKALWERYENGSLQKCLEDLLVTDEIKKMAEGKDVKLKVNIDQDSYRNACLDLLIVENEGKLFVREKCAFSSYKISLCAAFVFNTFFLFELYNLCCLLSLRNTFAKRRKSISMHCKVILICSIFNRQEQ